MNPVPPQLPMFPLGTVLFPGAVLPLQIFEARYLQMLAAVMDGEERFGVVLIERGSEVGGGDQRFDIGTVARIVRVGQIDDARLAVVTVGEQRIRVTEWLADDPYPEARIEAVADAGSSAIAAAVDGARLAFRRTLALASELGYDIGDLESEIPDDPAEAVWYLCAAAPLEEIDRQRLLESQDLGTRAEVLMGMLDDRSTLIEARLAEG